jgi:hypothetical protein
MLVEVNEVDLTLPLQDNRRVVRRLVNSESIIEVGPFDGYARDELARENLYTTRKHYEIGNDCQSFALCKSSRSERTFRRVLLDSVDELIARLNPRPGATPSDRLESAMNLMVASVLDTLASKNFDTRLRLLEDLAQARADGDAELVGQYTGMLREFDARLRSKSAEPTATRPGCSACAHFKVDPQELPCRHCADASHWEAAPEPEPAPVVCGAPAVRVEDLPKLLGDGEVKVEEPRKVEEPTSSFLRHPQP